MRKLGLIASKQSTAGLPRKGFLRRIRPRVTTPAIRPSLARQNHLRTQVISVQPDMRERTAIVVISPDLHLDLPGQGSLLERRTRRLTTGLANLGRVNPLDAKFARRAARVWPHPNCVTIRNISDFAAENRCRISLTEHRAQRQQSESEHRCRGLDPPGWPHEIRNGKETSSLINRKAKPGARLSKLQARPITLAVAISSSSNASDTVPETE